VNRVIPPLDLLFYLMETHNNPKHVAGLQIYEMPADAGENYMLELVEKLRRVPAVDPFNLKPVFPLARIPRWQSVEHMEMEYHLRHSALPKPGTMQQLMTVVQRLHAGILDRQRPGWICQVIEGLEGNRFAIYGKIHHAYIDGMSAMHRVYGSLSHDPKSREVNTIWGLKAESVERKVETEQGLAAQVLDLGVNTLTQAMAIGEVSAQILKVVMELARLRRHTGHIPFRAPRTRINNPVQSDLRSMGVTTLPLDQLKAIAKKAGCTVNDAVLAITDAAMHDYLVSHQDEPERPLVAMCPMSLRDANDDRATTQVATLLIELGQPRASLRDRLAQVAASAGSAKSEAREMSKDALIDFVLVVGGALELLQRTGLDRIVPQTYNVLVSNVPGPRTGQLYLLGSRLVANYPISTLTPGNNLNVTVLSHHNNLDFGLLAARGTLPDIELLVERMNRQFEALAREFGVADGAGRSKRTVEKAAKARAKTRAKAKTGPKTRAGGTRKKRRPAAGEAVVGD
jgi:diacylglycerol O-acyltransferase